MRTMRSTYDETRRHILDSGQTIIASKGFAAVGLNEILAAAGIPKGSFYHYFESKEQFGAALLEQYVTDYRAMLDDVLAANGTSARERLLRYWQHWRQTQCQSDPGSKCLVVKLSAEVADLSEPMRTVLRVGTDQLIARLAACIVQGQTDGSLAAELNPARTAQMLYQLWLGASLLTKLRQDDSALQEAWAVTQDTLYAPPTQP